MKKICAPVLAVALLVSVLCIGVITAQGAVVGDYIPGDVTGDGKVNVRDLGLLQQRLNGWDVPVNESAADVNGDGKMNVRDLGTLQQHLNGWDVPLVPGGSAVGGSTTPSTEPTTPSTEPTTPSTKPTTSPMEPTTPSTKPTTPSTEPTTPSTKPTTSPMEPTTPSTKPTTPSTKPTTTTTKPTAPPTPAVDMPGAGYDMDGKGRIVVQSSEVNTKNGVMTASFTFANVSKENGREWIIPEYSKVTYACYNESGTQLGTGTIILGALEGGDTVTRAITLPAGTVRVVFTGHDLEYWTPWA